MTFPAQRHDRAAPLAGARNRRDAGAERADRARQRRGQPDDHDRRDDAGLAVARMRSPPARSASVVVHAAAAVLHRRRRRARPARREPGRRRPRGLRGPARRAASGADQRLLLARRSGSCCGTPSADSARDRRTAGPRRRRRRVTCMRCNGRSPPPCSISPRASHFAALDRVGPTLVASLIAVVFNALAPTTSSIFGNFGLPALGICRLGPGDEPVADC